MDAFTVLVWVIPLFGLCYLWMITLLREAHRAGPTSAISPAPHSSEAGAQRREEISLPALSHLSLDDEEDDDVDEATKLVRAKFRTDEWVAITALRSLYRGPD